MWFGSGPLPLLNHPQATLVGWLGKGSGLVQIQCLKCRIPVKTIARPASSAAAITSSSRTEPPG